MQRRKDRYGFLRADKMLLPSCLPWKLQGHKSNRGTEAAMLYLSYQRGATAISCYSVSCGCSAVTLALWGCVSSALSWDMHTYEHTMLTLNIMLSNMWTLYTEAKAQCQCVCAVNAHDWVICFKLITFLSRGGHRHIVKQKVDESESSRGAARCSDTAVRHNKREVFWGFTLISLAPTASW